MPVPQELPIIEKVVTQDQVNRYAHASGDQNPIHLDPQFAASSSFGRIVAHGMLVLAFLSEMMTHAFGRRWLEGGSLKVRFKAPVYPGDRVTTFGALKQSKLVVSTPNEPQGGVTLATYTVGVSTSQGQEAITGEASVQLPSEGD